MKNPDPKKRGIHVPIPEMGDVTVYGAQEEEIAVTLDMDRIASYGVSPASLLLEYQSASLGAPGGVFHTDRTYSPVHVSNLVSTEEQVADRIVYTGPDGGVLRLGDIATVERRYRDPESFVSYDGHAALVLSVVMLPDNNIVEAFSATAPESVRLSRITDQPKVVHQSVMNFMRDLLIAMLVVVLVMLLLFPMRSALIASSGVPVCTAAALAVMYMTGMQVNMVTLAALIVVLGMIVDDSIITMDGYMDKLGRGLAREEAAVASGRELFMPMLMATTAISLMFFPTLGIIKGYLGDFIRSFPWIIAFALAASLAYAMLVVPSLEVHYIRESGPSRVFACIVKLVFGADLGRCSISKISPDIVHRAHYSFHKRYLIRQKSGRFCTCSHVYSRVICRQWLICYRRMYFPGDFLYEFTGKCTQHRSRAVC